MKFRFLVLCTFIAILTVSSCEKETVSADSIAQVARLDSLSAGQYDGLVSYEKLNTYGNFGLGTFDKLDGEMIYLDNEFYRVRTDGKAYAVEGSATAPFANITYFEIDQSDLLEDTLSYSQLQTYLDSVITDKSGYYAIKIAGQFKMVKTRSVHAQDKPYPPLSEVVEDQTVFEFENISGTMVGFRFPDEVGGANVQGYHFHFITADRQHGGHLLDCQTATLDISIDHATGIEMR